MKTIKDSIHDHIDISGAALELLDTPPVQRLRHIKQLGTVHLAYPSAHHTRFEHSLGVYHLAGEALEHLQIRGEAADHVRAAALLHDIGHPPYSHNIETLLERRNRSGQAEGVGKSHEDIEDLLIEGGLTPILESHDLDADWIVDLIAGRGQYGPLVSGELDVDRMDYLVRDARHTGVPYGTIDHSRLVHGLAFLDGHLVLDEGNVQTAENLLIARALMNQTVYNHHVARISKTMLRRAVERLLENGVSENELWRMDDHDLYSALREHEETRELARRISNRDLYKRAVWIGFENVPQSKGDAGHREVRAYEEEIATEADIEPEEVVVDIQPQRSMPELETRVIVDGEIRRLGEVSLLVGTLQEDREKKRRFGVYTPRDHREAVGYAAERVLGLETNGKMMNKRQTGYIPLDEFGQGDR